LQDAVVYPEPFDKLRRNVVEGLFFILIRLAAKFYYRQVVIKLLNDHRGDLWPIDDQITKLITEVKEMILYAA
jgi:hypothetical protein